MSHLPYGLPSGFGQAIASPGYANTREAVAEVQAAKVQSAALGQTVRGTEPVFHAMAAALDEANSLAAAVCRLTADLIGAVPTTAGGEDDYTRQGHAGSMATYANTTQDHLREALKELRRLEVELGL